MDFDYRLLAKYLVDELSLEELEEVLKWRSLSEENEKIFSEVVKLRVSWKYLRYNKTDKIEEALKMVHAKIDRKRRIPLFRIALRYAAVILLLVSFSYFGWQQWKPESYMSIVVKEGEDVKRVELADGSVVWLNAGSSLKIPGTFGKDNREVSLQGEAFFDVTSKKKFTFVVSTEYLNVKVLGTAFNVKTNENRKSVETILARGKVVLLDKQEHAVLDMSPGEMVTYDKQTNEYVTETVDVNTRTAWHLNQFVFENTTLREIAYQLENKFDVNINIESSELTQRKFRCVINEDESLIEILDQLKYLASVQYRVEDKEIFIYELKK